MVLRVRIRISLNLCWRAAGWPRHTFENTANQSLREELTTEGEVGDGSNKIALSRDECLRRSRVFSLTESYILKDEINSVKSRGNIFSSQASVRASLTDAEDGSSCG
jgi:hypothetical protein